MESVSKLIASMALLIASMALMVFSMSNATAFQSAAVSLGANPVVTFYCYGSNNTYTVPLGMDLIITDVSSYSSFVINADSTTVWEHYGSSSNTSKSHAFTTGIKTSSGVTVNCSSTSGYISGYLVQS